MPPAAVLRVLVQAAGVAATNRELMAVHARLEKVEGQALRTAGAIKALGDVHARPSVTLDSNVNTRQLATLERRLTSIDGRTSTAHVRVDVDDGALSTLAPRLRAVGAAGQGGASGVNTLSASVGGLHGPLGILSSLAIVFAIALLAIAGPAVAVAAALAPLVGLLAAAGAGAVAGAQGLGVFKLATMGVLDALKEQTTAHAGAGSSAAKGAAQQQAAARAIAAAQEGVRSAREGVAQASRQLAEAERTEQRAIDALKPAYAEARRRLVDLSAAVTDTALALAEAQDEARDARTALAQLLSGPSPRQLADAHAAVATAVRDEESAVRELIGAQRALDALLAPPDVLSVAEAQDAVSDSLRDQTRAALELSDQVAATQAVMANPASTGDAQARAQLALADAQNAVGDAARAATQAQSALDRLLSPPDVLAVADAQGRVADAQAAVTDAVNGTADARAALERVQGGPSDDEIARARLAVARAEHDVSTATTAAARAAEDYRTAEAAGVAGSPSVVAAREAVRSAALAAADAERGLASAHHQVALAQQGVRAAQASAAAGAADAAASAVDLNAKLNALPPSAQAFVRQLVSMKDKATELRTAAADGFFPGAGEGLTAAARNFEPVKRVVSATAGVLGDLARRAGELVGSGPFGKDLETIGTRNAKVLDTLGGAALHVVSAIRHVLVEVGPLTQWLADLAEKWSLNAAESAKAGRESGKMAAFFERTKSVLQTVGSIVGHVAHGLFGLGKAGSDSGDKILESIDAASARFDEWANSVGGQQSIREFFEDTRELAAALLPVVGGLAQGFAFLTLKLLPLATALRILGPLADEVIVAFLSYKLAATGVAAATALANGVIWIMGTRLGALALYTVAWRVSAIAATVATKAMAAGQWLLNTAFLGFPLIWIIAGIAALVAGLIYAYTHSETFRKIIDAAFAAVATAFGWLLQAAQDTFGWLRDNWPLVLAILTGPIGLAVLVIAKHWEDIKGAASKAWNWIKGAADTAWNAIKTAITAPIRAAADVLGKILDEVAGFLGRRWDNIKTAAGVAWRAVKSAIVDPVGDAISFIHDKIGDVVGWIAEKWGAITTGAKVFGLLFGNTMARAFGSIANVVIGFVNLIIGAINKIPGVEIGKVGKVDVPDRLSIKDATKQAQGFAHGGAYARTGGYVDGPITLMGEEAPRHPEYVIPTNPAYRGRAHALLMQAAGTLGLAQGGRYSQAAMSALWKSQGGGDAAIAGAVGMAESGGDPNAANGPYHGLWQVGPGGPFDPILNARAGIAKWRAGGSSVDARWRPWEAYTGSDGVGSDGPWRKFIGGGDDDGGDGLWGAVKGAVGKVGGIIGDLMEKGASFILDKLPGVDSLPEWLRGMGKSLLDTVGGWIKDKVSGLIGGGDGGGTGPAPGGAAGGVPFDGKTIAGWIRPILAEARAAGVDFHVSSGLRTFAEQTRLWNQLGQDPAIVARPGTSNHEGTKFPRGAVDISPGWAQLAAHLEQIGSPLKHYGNPRDPYHFSATGHKMGGIYGGGVMGSYEFGTDYVPRTGLYELHQGEKVTPAAHNKATDGTENRLDREAMDRLSAALEAILASGHAGAIDALADVVNEKVGFGAGQRRSTSANPSNRRFIL